MKKTIKISLTILASVLLMAASNGKGASEIYEMIESNSSSTFSMNVNQDFKDLFDMDMDLNGTEKMVKGDFKRGKILIVDKEDLEDLNILKAFDQRGYFMTKVEDDPSTLRLRSVQAGSGTGDDEKEEDEELYVFTDVKGDDIHEVHFYLLGEEKAVLMSIYGDIHLEKK